MKCKRLTGLFAMMLVVAGIGYAADDKTSLGAQAGEAARELQGTTAETLSTGAVKVAETSKKVEAETQDALKSLQQQWDVLAKQLQEKAQQLQKELNQQWQDFNKSFNNPPKA